MDRASFEPYFDHPYEEHDAILQDGAPILGTVYRASNQIYHLNMDSVFEPDDPILVRIYSTEPVKCTGVTRLH
jgi:hypothetical protein